MIICVTRNMALTGERTKSWFLIGLFQELFELQAWPPTLYDYSSQYLPDSLTKENQTWSCRKSWNNRALMKGTVVYFLLEKVSQTKILSLHFTNINAWITNAIPAIPRSRLIGSSGRDIDPLSAKSYKNQSRVWKYLEQTIPMVMSWWKGRFHSYLYQVDSHLPKLFQQ